MRITITFGKLRITVYIKNNRRDLENSGGNRIRVAVFNGFPIDVNIS